MRRHGRNHAFSLPEQANRHRQLGCRLACEMLLRRVGGRHDDTYLPELRRLPLSA